LSVSFLNPRSLKSQDNIGDRFLLMIEAINHFLVVFVQTYKIFTGTGYSKIYEVNSFY